jgi:signal transduction histidine kinase
MAGGCLNTGRHTANHEALSRQQGLSIRLRLWMAAALPALLVLVALVLGFFDRHNRELTEALTDRAKAAAKQLAGAAEFPLFAGDHETLQHLVTTMLNGDPQLLRAAVFSTQGQHQAIVGDRSLPVPTLGHELQVQQSTDHIGVMVPVYMFSLAKSDWLETTRSRSTTHRGQLIGHVLLDFSMAPLEQQRQELLVWTLLTTGLALLLAGWLSLRLASNVTQPIAAITQVVERIGAGDSQARINSQLSGPLQVLALGINDMAARVEITQDQMKQQIEVATQELRDAFERLRVSDRQHIIASERQRLIRDMHDGVGSQLVQILNLMHYSTGPKNLATMESMLKYALEELRMTLDSLEPMEGDLPAILGTLRYRLAPALEAAGIELVWEVEDVPPTSLDSQGVLNLFRCLQEVFANVVQHAGARNVTVRTWADEELVHLSVQDDGHGRPVDHASPSGGRGLQNIRVRAETMGAKVRYYDADPGFGVAFDFELLTKNP